MSVCREPFDPYQVRIEFDASPWGGGAVLFERNQPTEFFSTAWKEDDVPHLGVHPGVSAHQTFYELSCLGLALIRWGSTYQRLVLVGDNTGSLQLALDGRGYGAQGALLRELSWRKAKHGWDFAVAHTAKEANSLADFLSRIHEPKGDDTPPAPPACPEAFCGCAEVRAPKLSKIWSLRDDPVVS